MKKLWMAVLSALLMAGCTEMMDVTSVKDVEFRMDDLMVDYQTRSSIASTGVTDVWILDGTSVLAHKTSSDTDLASPTVALTYGEHTLTFLASASHGQTATGSKWTSTKIDETFCKRMTVNVTGGTNQVGVELKRRVAKLMFVIEDAVPLTIEKMHVKVAQCLSMQSDLTGGDAGYYETTVNIASQHGKTGYSPSVCVLPVSATDEEDCEVMIEFLGSDGDVLYHYERVVGMKANRYTNLRGNYFSGNGASITVDTTWDTANDVGLYE